MVTGSVDLFPIVLSLAHLYSTLRKRIVLMSAQFVKVLQSLLLATKQLSVPVRGWSGI